MQPTDKDLGINLNINEGKTLAIHARRKFKPLLLMVAWPCVLEPVQ